MKACFYWLNLATPPGMSIGVSILAHELADAGHDVSVVLLNERAGMPFEPGRLAEHARRGGFDLHALSFGQNHYAPAMRLASVLKEAAPDSRVLCGGVHTTLNAEEVLGHPDVDYVGIGEADGLMAPFVDRLESGGDMSGLPGFWSKTVRNPMAPLPDITDQTSLFLDGIDYAPIIAAARGFAETVVGRGCPMKCNYCHNAAIQDTYRRLVKDPASKLRFCRLRSVDNVIAELSAFKSKYPDAIRAFNFGDDVFASDRDWLRDFSARYAAGIGLPFISNAIAGQIDEEIAGMLADAGCNMVKFGVESGSERVRREVLNRRLSEPRLAESVGMLHRQGINTRAYVMLGMPTETPDEMQATLKLCAGLRFDSVRPAIMYPFPGTQIHQLCVEQNLIDDSSAPTDYSTTTILRLPEPERVRIEKTAALYPWLLNACLGGEAAAASQPLIDRVRAESGPDWRRLLDEEREAVHRSLIGSGVEHYHAPFSDRQDVIFLYRRRIRPLINVEGGGQP